MAAIDRARAQLAADVMGALISSGLSGRVRVALDAVVDREPIRVAAEVGEPLREIGPAVSAD